MNKNRRILPLFLIASLAAFSLPGMAAEKSKTATASQTKHTYSKQKVVYHMDDAEKAGTALRYVQNHINAVGAENVSIVVVSHVKGVDFLLDGWKDSSGKSYETMVQDLANQGVKFDVCNNTLKARNIDPDTLNMNATIVPAGVADIAELQMKGYAYVKP